MSGFIFQGTLPQDAEKAGELAAIGKLSTRKKTGLDRLGADALLYRTRNERFGDEMWENCGQFHAFLAKSD